MIQVLKAAVRAVRSELATGQSGWVSTSVPQGVSSSSRGSDAGQQVSAQTTLCLSAAYDCVRKTSQLVATLPLHLYERTADGGRREVQNDLSEMLCHSPNRAQTNVEFWEGLIAATVMQGNSYAERMMIGQRTIGLRPLFNVTPCWDRERGIVEYQIYDRGRRERLPAEKVFHLRGFGAGDGVGLSAIRYGANSIGAALAADQTAGKVFSNSMMPSGTLSVQQVLNKEQRGELQEIMSEYAGSQRAGKLMVLEGGLSYSPIQMNPEDAQLLETRRFNVEDVCRWFGVPPIIVGHAAEGQTMWGSGVEQIMLSWLTLGINPLLTRVEARINRDLVPVTNRRRFFFRFNREAMLQMDSKAKGEFLTKMRFAGIMSGDEGRDKLNLPRRGGASDDLIVQTSLAPVETIGKDPS